MLAKVVAYLVAVPLVQAPAVPPVTAESFLPENAALVVRLKSLDDLTRFAGLFMVADAANEGGFDPLSLLKKVTAEEARWDLVDRSKPVLLASSGAAGAPPVTPTLIVSCRDAQAFAADPAFQAKGWKCTAAGNVVALSQGAAPKLASKPCALAAGLDAHDFVARIDVRQVMAAFGELIDGALSQMEDGASSAAGAGVTGGATLNVVDGIRSALESTSTFEIHLAQRGDESTLGFELVQADASSATKTPNVDPASMAMLGRCIDPDSAMVYASTIDTSQFMSWYATVLDQMPEPMREQIKSSITGSREVYALMGPTMCAGVSCGDSGIRMSIGIRPKAPAAFAEAYADAMKKMGPMVRVSGRKHEIIDGMDVEQIRVSLDLDALKKSIGAPEESSPEVDGAAENAFNRIFGTDGMRISLVQRDGAVFVQVGPDSDVKAMIARLKSETLAQRVRGVLDSTLASNPGFAIYLDVARFLDGMMSFAAAMSPETGADSFGDAAKSMKDLPPIQVAGGVDGRAWKLSISLGTKKLAGIIQARIAKKAGEVKRAQALADVARIRSALEEYATANARKYPDSLEVLVRPDSNGQTFLKSPKLPLDPWKRPYSYEPPAPPKNPAARVFSLGADGKVGGSGDDADIDSESALDDER